MIYNHQTPSQVNSKPQDMEKKITVTLSDEAYEYFCEVAYSLDKGDGKVATQSEIINHCLLELYVFEKLAGQSVTGYLSEGWPEEYQKEIDKLDYYDNP